MRSRAIPATWQASARSHQELADLFDDVVVGRHDVLLLRPALPVHQHHRRAALGDQRHQGRIVLQRRHVVDDARAGIEAGARHGGAAGVDRHHDSALGQALDHGQDALQFFVGIDRPRARPRRLAADIDDVGTLRNETQAIVDGLRWVRGVRRRLRTSSASH